MGIGRLKLVEDEYVSTVDVKNKTPFGFRKARGETYWVYLTKTQVRRYLKIMGTGSQEFFDVWYKMIDNKSPINEVNKKGFNPFDLYRMDWDSHLLYSWGEDTPVSRPYYINVVVNDEYDLDKAFKILSKHSWVSNVDKVEIPPYNQREGYTRLVEFTVHLPQKEYDKLVHFWRDEKEEIYWSCQIEDSFVGTHFADLGLWDILGLNPAWIGSRYAKYE